MGSGASCATSAITVQFDEVQPFVAGQDVTGTVEFQNTFEKDVKLQHIYAEFIGEVVYTIKRYNGSGYYNATYHDAFFRQLISLQKEKESFTLENDYCSWPICFSLPTFLPPSLNQLSTHGPFIRYNVRVVFERPEMYKMNIRRNFSVFVIADPSSYAYPLMLPMEAKNKNSSDVILQAAIVDQAGPLVPGGSFLLNVELHNPNHVTIKRLPIHLKQHRDIWMGGHCELTITLADLLHLREFSGEHYHETFELKIPSNNGIIPSFYYMPPTHSDRPIAVKYMLQLEVKIHGFFKNFVLNIPVVFHSNQTYMKAPKDEEEAAPPPYDLVFAKQ